MNPTPTSAATLTDDEDLPDVPAVEFGGTPEARINYLSVSQLKTAAPWVHGGCKRKWWLKKVKGLKEPEDKSLEIGKAVHAQLEHYMKTGDEVLGPIARAALPHLPPPKSTPFVEKSITASNKPITGARLTVDGIPMVGFIDRVDPPNSEAFSVPRVEDYKTSGDPAKWAPAEDPITKQCAELATTASGHGIQGLAYVLAEESEFPEAEAFDVEFLFLHKKPTKKQVAAGEDAIVRKARVGLAHARAEWNARMPALARELRDIARCSKVTDVEANYSSCTAYRGCHFYALCLAADASATASPTPEKQAMSLGNALARRRLAQTPAASSPPPEALKPEEMKGTLGGVDVGALEALVANQAKQPDPVVVPPDAPKSDPKLAADPLPETKPTESVEDQFAKVETERLEKTEPKKRGPKAVIVREPKTLAVFVNCVPNKPAISLTPYVNEITATMLRPFPDVSDLRCAPKKGTNAAGQVVDHPYAFGAWKGHLASQVKLTPPPPGTYVVIGGDEIVQTICDALESIAPEFTKAVR